MSHPKNTFLGLTVCEVFYAFIEDVVSVNRTATAKTLSVTFVPAKSWVRIYSTPGSIDYEEPVENTAAGKLWKQQLSLFYPGINPSNLSEFDNMDNRRFVVKFVLSNGISYIIGNTMNPVKFDKNLSVSSGGSNIVFYKNSTEPALLLQI